MKKLLLATTVLAASATVAAAEVKFSGSAGMGLQYNSEGGEKTKQLSYATLTVDMSGESDSGLAFGANMNFKVTNNGTVDNDDTTVFMEGAFGKLSMGAVGEADEVAGLGDIGWDGLDVDDVAESIVGDELGDLTGVSIGHNVNYTYKTGGLQFSLSGRLPDSHAATTTESYAVGVKYSADTFYVGLGYAAHDTAFTAVSEFGVIGGAAGTQDSKVTSLYAGTSFGDVKLAALYAMGDHDLSTGQSIDSDTLGLNVAYKMGALGLSAGYSKANFDVSTGASTSEEAYGIGASYDLGGGAVVKGGIASIKSGDEGSGTFLVPVRETRADFGISFSF